VDALIQFGLTNAVAATVLAVVVAILAKLWRRPAGQHALWLVVLVKLLAPPLVVLPIVWPRNPDPPAPRTPEPAAVEVQGPLNPAAEVLVPQPEPSEDPAVAVEPAPVQPDQVVGELPAAPVPVEASAPVVESSPTPEPLRPIEWTWLLGFAWLGGSVIWFAVALSRIRRFQCFLKTALPAPAAVQQQAMLLARRLGLADCPRIWLTSGALSPLLWSVGGSAKILVPAGLVERLDTIQLQALLIHELAHYRRRDHWTRRLEMVVLCLYWWLPTAWYARRCLRDAEEECCDAWVVWALPEAKKSYASALVETWDFLSQSAIALPPAATGAVQLNLLRRRLTMIMRGTTPRNLGVFGVPAALAIAILFLPLWPSLAQREENSQPPGANQVELQKAKVEIERAKAELEASKARLEFKKLELQAQLSKIEQEYANTTKEFAEAKRLADLFAEAHGAATGKSIPPLVSAPQADSMEKRIAAMEKKLDRILDELKALRANDLAKHKAAFMDAISAVRSSKAALDRLHDLFEKGAVPLTLFKQVEKQLQSDNNFLLTEERTLRFLKLTNEEIETLRAEANKLIDSKKSAGGSGGRTPGPSGAPGAPSSEIGPSGIAPVPPRPAPAPSPGLAPAAGAAVPVPRVPAVAPVPPVDRRNGGIPDVPAR
jgi:beta-lactamase regulating signal transducer with metallopeptidase domain